jgi:ribonuclease HII
MKKSRNVTSIPTLDVELALRKEGYTIIGGADEAGRGSVFGPVCVGIAVLPLIGNTDDLKHTLREVRDSKKIARPKVYRLAEVVKTSALAWGVGESSAQEIDQFGIRDAISLAAERAWFILHENTPRVQIDFLLTDSTMKVDKIISHHRGIVKGDSLCLSIACGAILAKNHHDILVRELLHEHGYRGEYGLDHNVGYPTPAHKRAIQRYGRTEHHRKTWNLKPIADNSSD